MKIAVGSLNKTKIEAVDKALKKIEQVFRLDSTGETVLHPVATETSVPSMPLNQIDIMKGAQERAVFAYERLRTAGIEIDLAIGLEGGVYKMPENSHSESPAFLQNWVYAYDGSRGFFGSSLSLPVPDKIRLALYDEGKELSEVIDGLSGLKNVRSKQGAFGVLTRNLITRSDSFEMAVVTAMVPFLNGMFYPDIC